MTDRNVLGRPIHGDITQYGFKRYEQWDAEKFLEMLDAVFEADAELTSVRWRQYTPYFNDGDPCEFGAYMDEDAIASFGGIPEDWPYESGEEDSYSDEEGNPVEILSLSELKHGKRTKYRENPNPKDRWDRWEYYDVPCRQSAAGEALDALASNFAHFEDFLRENFGDHAKVVATREGFNVEYYEHD